MTFMCSFPQEELGFLYFPPPLLKKKYPFLLLIVCSVAETKEDSEGCPLVLKVLLQQSKKATVRFGVAHTLTRKTRVFSL